MDAIEVFEKVKEGTGEYERIVGLLRDVKERLITPEEAVEILQDETGVVVLENQP